MCAWLVHTLMAIDGSLLLVLLQLYALAATQACVLKLGVTREFAYAWNMVNIV